MKEKNLFIIAGCNGAGKTTASFTILPDILDCKKFVNADEIARGLSPFQPETKSFEAGKLMLEIINELLKGDENFALETTLSSKIYIKRFYEAKKNGWKIILQFFYLKSTELAKERVKIRVKEGGHNIPPNVIERRFYRGIENLFDCYLDLADELYIFDNSRNKPVLVANKLLNSNFEVIDTIKFDELKKLSYENK